MSRITTRVLQALPCGAYDAEVLRRIRRLAVATFLGAIVLTALGVVACRVSPRPGVALIRLLFERGAAKATKALQEHVPEGIESIRDVRFPTGVASFPELAMDVFHPPGRAGTDARPFVFWIHGGAWVSGRKEDVGAYLHVLAGDGLSSVAVDYTLAPDATYPTQLRQVNAALAHLVSAGTTLGLDVERVLFAGDSAGAQLAAQLAAIHTDADYARRVGIQAALPAAALRGVILFCGAYDFGLVDYDGLFGPFLRTVVFALFGRRDASVTTEFDEASVLRHVTAAFPPAFVSAGNGDPLLRQSEALAERLTALGVPLETLFFAPTTKPALGHEYQFNLDVEAGRQARARSVEFALARLAAR